MSNLNAIKNGTPTFLNDFTKNKTNEFHFFDEKAIEKAIEKYRKDKKMKLYDVLQFEGLYFYLAKMKDQDEPISKAQSFLRGTALKISELHSDYKEFVTKKGKPTFGLNAFEKKLAESLKEINENLTVISIFKDNQRAPKYLKVIHNRQS